MSARNKPTTHKRWRRGAALVMATIAGTLMVLIGTAPAQAAPSGCASGALCAWEDENYLTNSTTVHASFFGNNQHWSDFAQSACQSGNWNDCASSIFNNGTQCTAHVYWDAGFGLPRINVPRGTGYAQLDQNMPDGRNWNDKISSNNWC